MDLSSSYGELSPEKDILAYSRWQDILRSWFWRYYDHLLLLTLFNFGWFLSCIGLGWLACDRGHWGSFHQWNWVEITLLYFIECSASVFWALAVFNLLMGGKFSWALLWKDFRRFYLKAVLSLSSSILILSLALYNLRFYFDIKTSAQIGVFILMGFVATVFLYVVMMTFYQWPLLFFQNPPLGKLIYRSFLVTMSTGPVSLLLLLISSILITVFTLMPFLWFFTGMVLLFSLYLVAVEKHLLRYRITYQDRSISDCLESADQERQRGWRDIFKPWETQ